MGNRITDHTGKREGHRLAFITRIDRELNLSLRGGKAVRTFLQRSSEQSCESLVDKNTD